jgi:hypothetical protein
MSGSLESTRDLARYFTMAGISVRPEAVKGLLGDLRQYKFHEEKLNFLSAVLKLFKEQS